MYMFAYVCVCMHVCVFVFVRMCMCVFLHLVMKSSFSIVIIVIKVMTITDLPTRPYLVWKSARHTDVRPYFSKYGRKVSRKYGNCDVNNASSLPAKPIIEH